MRTVVGWSRHDAFCGFGPRRSSPDMQEYALTRGRRVEIRVLRHRRTLRRAYRGEKPGFVVETLCPGFSLACVSSPLPTGLLELPASVEAPSHGSVAVSTTAAQRAIQKNQKIKTQGIHIKVNESDEENPNGRISDCDLFAHENTRMLVIVHNPNT